LKKRVEELELINNTTEDFNSTLSQKDREIKALKSRNVIQNSESVIETKSLGEQLKVILSEATIG
jgi:hypothetical protein